MFEVYQVKKNENWAKYTLQGVSKKIKRLDEFTKIIIEIGEQVFEILFGMQPEWRRWIICLKDSEEVIEVNMIFPVRQQNICPMPK